MEGLKKLVAQFLKFGVVGVIATGIDFGIMIFLTEVFGVDPVISSGISFCTSTVFNYLASMRFVFKHREDLSKRRELIIFVVLSLIGLGLNQLIMWGGTTVLGEGWYVLVKVVATGIVMLWNFFSRKHWLDADHS
ncbi:GtrA family protein [Tractidigestivibacter scatoligenes]|jgi:putative flippase GtrA|uniref:GtrA family protein n=1 Tax=Tractidigestivibacter scatoligenes TaxID=1299998 RepID=UPI002F36015B